MNEKAAKKVRRILKRRQEDNGELFARMIVSVKKWKFRQRLSLAWIIIRG